MSRTPSARPSSSGARPPHGVEVDLRGFTLFGDKRLESTRAGWSHAAPRITVRGFTLFGDVRVRTA